MSKFKVGQQVRVVLDDSDTGMDTPPEGSIGRVVHDFGDPVSGVEFDSWDASEGAFFYRDDELEAVE